MTSSIQIIIFKRGMNQHKPQKLFEYQVKCMTCSGTGYHAVVKLLPDTLIFCFWLRRELRRTQSFRPQNVHITIHPVLKAPVRVHNNSPVHPLLKQQRCMQQEQQHTLPIAYTHNTSLYMTHV